MDHLYKNHVHRKKINITNKMEKKIEVKVTNVKIDKEKSIVRLKNAPLTAIKTSGGYVITFGKHMIHNKKFKTIAEIEKFLTEPKNIYTIIPVMSYVYYNEINNINNNKNETK